MKANVVKDAISINVALRLEGKLVLETACRDFAAYCALPAAVTYEGVTCGLTGWSSDRGYACYKEGAMLAYKTVGPRSIVRVGA